MLKKLVAKPGMDPERRAHQRQVKTAIVEGTTFGVSCLLAELRTRRPYANYAVPDSLAQFEFTLKGLMRLEMMAQDEYKGWRRLFGANTRAQDISTWKSRVLPKAFAHAQEAQRYLRACPIGEWQNGSCPMLSQAVTDKEWLVLLQVHDVLLEDGSLFSDLLRRFLSGDSEVLSLVAQHSCLGTAGR